MRYLNKISVSAAEPGTGTLWVDISSTSPIVKVFDNGEWKNVAAPGGTVDDLVETVRSLINRVTNAETSIEDNAGSIHIIENLIPNQATENNQLADKDFVNSSIATNTATFKGTFNSIANLPTTDVDDNDYAFVVTTDAAGNTVYKRYKYNGSQWVFEYDLNNSSFTAAQWAAIQSGITSTIVQNLHDSDKLVRSNDVKTISVVTALPETITPNTEYNIIES